MRKDAALAELRRIIDDPSADVDSRLPTERALAERIGCSRETLRTALDVLEAEGKIWRQVGKGTFRGRPPQGTVRRETILLEGATPEDLIEARLAIEPAIATQAARHARPEDIPHLDRLIRAGRNSASREEAERHDAAFHGAIADLSGNPILSGLLGFLSNARRRSAWQREWERTYRRLGVSEFTGLHSDQHKSVRDAIAARDPEAAAAAMARHLDTIARAMRREEG